MNCINRYLESCVLLTIFCLFRGPINNFGSAYCKNSVPLEIIKIRNSLYNSQDQFVVIYNIHNILYIIFITNINYNKRTMVVEKLNKSYFFKSHKNTALKFDLLYKDKH